MADRVVVFDTTLRDGEQSPGFTLNIDEKLQIAKQLEVLGVDVIEAGFPPTSPGDWEAVRLISQEVREASIAALTHADVAAIDRTWDALRVGVNPRIHIVLSTSDVHLIHQLRKSREQVMEQACSTVAHAAKLTNNVEFSAMDTTRSDPKYVYELFRKVIEAGATTVNIADTVGYIQPDEFTEWVRGIFENVPNIHQAVVSIHCHNDLGMATANSLAGLRGGARQVECTINGIGERAGNASLEEIVMALRVRSDRYQLNNRIATPEIYKTSRMLSELTGVSVQPNKAIVGANAFRHESGLHQDGILQERTTYEIMDASWVGVPTSDHIILGKHSGRAGFRRRMTELGYELEPAQFQAAFERFKELADKKKVITDGDLESIVADQSRLAFDVYSLEHVQVSCGDHSLPTATVKIVAPNGQVLQDASIGTGPVDAVYKAINRIIQVPNQLTEFTVKSVTEGIDAVGEVTIKVEGDGRTFIGRGGSTDIIVASAMAYMNALNRLLATQSVMARQDAKTPVEAR